MNRDELSHIAHTDHPIACPFGDDTVTELLARLAIPPGGQILDIGCGSAEWLLRLLAHGSAPRDATGLGIDRSACAIEAARARAAALGVDDRATLVRADAAQYLDEHAPAADAALCMGATHALGGLGPTLARLRALVGPGGCALVGEGFWQRPPTEAALTALGADITELPDRAGLEDAARAAGFTLRHFQPSSPSEWDHYEQSWCTALERYADAHPSHPDADHLRQVAQRHRDAYLDGYRGVLGFAAMVLTA